MKNWDSLAVLSMDGRISNQVVWPGKESIFPAETCARHVYVGHADNLKTVPADVRDHRRTKLFAGASAYQFLIELYVGLKSPRGIFDENVAGQVRSAWKRHVQDQPVSHKKIKPFIDAIFHDGSLVKTLLMPYQRHPTLINTAIEKAELAPEKTALVICGSVSTSVEAITALATKRAVNPGTILLTHPNENDLRIVDQEVKNLRYPKALKADLIYTPLQKALSSIQQVDAIIVCQPMGNGVVPPPPDLKRLNEEICTRWKHYCQTYPDHQTKLVHIKGDPHLRGETVGPWLHLCCDERFIPFPTLKEETQKRVSLVKQVAAKTREAVRLMQNMRMEGDRLTELTLDPETLELNYKLARRPQLAKVGGVEQLPKKL